MADFKGFKKSGTTYDCYDGTARSDISTINGKIPSGASSSNKLATASDVNAKVGWSDVSGYVGKNLWQTTLFTDKTIVGVRAVVNADKSITITGSNTSGAANVFECSQIPLKAGSYRLVGANGGSENTVNLQIYVSPSQMVYDIGSGVDLTLASDSVVKLRVYFKAGISNVNLTFYPMLVKQGVPTTPYEPYIPDNTELFPRSEQAVLGAKNRLAYDLASLKALNTTGTWSSNVYTWRNVQYTVNADLSITAHKTGDLSQESYINLVKYNSSNPMPYAGKSMTLNGCPSGGGSSKYRIKFEYGNGASHEFDNGGGVTFTANMPASGDQYVQCSVISITDDITFKPMIRDSADTDSTYQPYAMTNRELTEIILSSATNAHANITLDSTYNLVAKQANVVNFKVRFTVNTALSGSQRLFTLLKPFFFGTFFTLYNRSAPYEPKSLGAYIDESGNVFINGELATGSYDLCGTYICA